MLEMLLMLMLQQTPSCPVENKEFLLWGAAGGNTVQTAPVPKGKVWMMREAGIASTDSTGADWRMELLRPVRSQNNACCWRVPIAISTSWRTSTPVLALERPLVMHEGEILAGRANGVEAPYQMALLGVYYEVPSYCLGALGGH